MVRSVDEPVSDCHSLHDIINIISKNVEGFGVDVGVRDERPEIDCVSFSYDSQS